ncbi:MAG TPA: DUF1501 domain-containing protein [Candidatus Limnocylindrales bacterium]|nr:DUF1501 domain-containing protein [Candidatus Limnocylindrales bacterium]
MALTRRQFLKRSATLAAGATVAPAMKWLPGTGVAYAAGPSDAIVVFVQLFGGNDSLNMVYPTSLGTQRTKYEEYRPTLKLPRNGAELTVWGGSDPQYEIDVSKGVLNIGNDSLGTTYALNPAMKALHDIYDDGELAVVPGVHYPYADYSHFRSEVIYYTGDPIGSAGFGWMGKYLDLSGYSATEVPAVMLGGEYNPLFTPTGTSLFAFNRLSELRFPSGHDTTNRSAAFKSMYQESAASGGLFPELVNIGNTGVAAIDTFQQYYLPGQTNIGKVEGLMVDGDGNYDPYNDLTYTSPLNYNNGVFRDTYLTSDLRHVAAVIRSDVGARFFHVGIGGFDTHSNQEDDFYHSRLLQQVSEAIGAFWAEMKNNVTLPAGYVSGDISSKVMIVTVSEFGRTNKQNNDTAQSAGTDHGRSGSQFVVGPASIVNPGITGPFPTLDDPDLDDDMRMTHDFRDFYGTILQKWLNLTPAQIGPGNSPADPQLFVKTATPDWLGQSYTAYTALGFLS